MYITCNYNYTYHHLLTSPNVLSYNLPTEHWLLSVADLLKGFGLSQFASKARLIEFVPVFELPPEPPELVLLDETLDIDMTECGRFTFLQASVNVPIIEFLNLGIAEIKISFILINA